MGMFSKIIAFLDKAAGVPAWVIHADNIRKLEERGCPTLAKAIVENEILWPMAPLSLEEVVPQIAGMVTIGKVVAEDKALGSERLKQLVHEVVAAYEGPVEGPLEVLRNFVEVVEVDAPSSLATFAEKVFAVETATPLEEVDLVEAFDVILTRCILDEKSSTPDLDNLDTDTIPLDEAAKAQLLQGMMAVISRGRKPAPTLKVLNNMSMGDKSLVVEALSQMEAKGNTLAKAILEDPSL